MTTCPCGSMKAYAQCCESYIKGAQPAPTAEALMRSRYTAHVVGDFKYLRETIAPESRHDYNEVEVKKWVAASHFEGLTIHQVKDGLEKDKKGVVEFTAKYRSSDKGIEHHEVSQFRKDAPSGKWYFVDGEAHTHEEGQGHHQHTPQEPVKRADPKIGRNDPCPCGSGKKYKKCCEAA
jgi:SEC-C motif-containing protein